jgi:hypothetical protein
MDLQAALELGTNEGGEQKDVCELHEAVCFT